MTRVQVRPAIVRWARERAGRSRDALRTRFPRLQAWEEGSVAPTLKQLEDFARAVWVPIGYLFLAEPPVERLNRQMHRVDLRSGTDAQLNAANHCPGVITGPHTSSDGYFSFD